MIYVASPYSGPTNQERFDRYICVLNYTAQLLRDKSWCYSPIVHCHNIAAHHDLPYHFDFWREYNEHMLSRSDALHVLQLPGWEDSKGVQAEIRYWTSLGGIPKLVPWTEGA